MLTHIYIKNFAIIREIDIDPGDGLNIITGETGTGKSIVIQAISMALGGRGSSSVIAEGQDKALVQLVFSPGDDERDRLLQNPEYEHFVSAGDDLIISREFSRSGRSLARINGEIVNLNILTGFTSSLMDIHGQYDNQTFLDSDSHMAILDNYAGSELKAVRDKVAEKYSLYQSVRQQLLKLRSGHAELLRRQDFMRFEVREIDAADLKADEDTELSSQFRLLQNSEKIYQALSESYEIISSCALDRCRSLLEGIADYGENYSALSSSMNDSLYAIEDLCDQLRKERDAVSFTPGDIDNVMNRLNLIDNLKMKYGGSIEKVLEYRDTCARELKDVENKDESEKELTHQLSALRKEVLALSADLTEMRKKAAVELSEEMTRQLSELNFPNARFEAQLSQNTNSEGGLVLSSSGTDKAIFMFNANKGGSLKPLSEVASGGEISRIALAFKNITGSAEHVPTLIFDEIDTGISGITASVVGRKLNDIARYHQIICITHLPQIAACGDHQFRISKDDSDEGSYTTIRLLDHDERIQEIARLLGGTNITETTIASASELLAASKHK